jgi:hypothetical protein
MSKLNLLDLELIFFVGVLTGILLSFIIQLVLNGIDERKMRNGS